MIALKLFSAAAGFFLEAVMHFAREHGRSGELTAGMGYAIVRGLRKLFEIPFAAL